ncbi:putative ATP binding protein [Taphrina deformans PYCC 5710]|uniref:GPN-loop GTPase 2 n=1 Tax=Taphrina deformans (strain PYCC 5710 / ATCC 11124 / CBS 356.35 / IMI 108563 / JCM 9778 / NBRC 8474) TaxID=1097556 RepID=R4X901_TAPDE|nr:putative ATP binding protein [Taphrina deformans PYCC 5710]|eukprot:CCG80627.1 putative ATP binding protein [Taphrina deformans PYCC 5710]
MPFGQIVVGPPGSGKSTYCSGAHQFLGAIGRKVSIVNLDPANESYTYPCALDVMDLIKLEDIMEADGLGPNGGIIHALEALEENFDWLEHGLSHLKDDYVIFDCPGQVELFTHHDSLRNIITKLEKLGYRLVVLHLVDAHYCSDPAKYISVLMLALRSMLQLDLPHINVLSKIDLLNNYSGMDFNLDYYTEVQDLSYLLPRLEADSRLAKYAKLNAAICEMVEDFSLVQFETLCVEDKRSMARLLQQVDRAGGYAFGSSEISADTVWADAVRGGWLNTGNQALDDQERWITQRDVYERAERDNWEQEGKQAQGQTPDV